MKFKKHLETLILDRDVISQLFPKYVNEYELIPFSSKILDADLVSLPKREIDYSAKYESLKKDGWYPLKAAIALTNENYPSYDAETLLIDWHFQRGLSVINYLPYPLCKAPDPFNPFYMEYSRWVEKIDEQLKQTLQKQEDESYVYYDAELGYFETEVNTNTNTNKINKTMTRFYPHLKSLPKPAVDYEFEFEHLKKDNRWYPLDIAIKLFNKNYPSYDAETFLIDEHLNKGLSLTYFLPYPLNNIATCFSPFYREYKTWLDKKLAESNYPNSLNNTNKTMTNSNFVFAYNVKDINKTDSVVKGSLTLPDMFVKQNASVIPACMWTFGKNKCIQFEYMGNIRIIKVDSTNPNALIKNVAKGESPIFQLVFSLDMSSKKDLRAKEAGVLPVVYYSANKVEGNRTEVAVREFSQEQFESKVISLGNILSVYSPISERDFFIAACSEAKQVNVVTPVPTPVTSEASETPVTPASTPVVCIEVIGDNVQERIVKVKGPAPAAPKAKTKTVKEPKPAVIKTAKAAQVSQPQLVEEVVVETTVEPEDKKSLTAKEQKAIKHAAKLADDKAKKEARLAKKAAKHAAKLAQQESLTKVVEETIVVVTDDQEQSKETVIVNTINTKETKTMDFQDLIAKTNAARIQQAALNLSEEPKLETKPMSDFQKKYASKQAVVVEPTSSISQEEDDLDAYCAAMDAQEDNTVAAANGQEKSEEIAPITNTNSIPNNKTMDNAKPRNRKLVSIELVVNIIAAIGGDCARKSHSVAKRTEKLNVLRNKNSKTVSNVRGYGAIRTNSNDGSCFLDVNVFPETAMTVYNTNNRPVIIFHYDDNTQAIQSEANTEKFWRKVLHASEEVVIPNINPTLKVDLPAGADVLCERIDAGTIQAVSIKFTNMDKKMFSYYSTDVSGRFIVHLKAAGDYDVSLLRDTVEVSDNFLNYNGEKGAVNNFAGASKTGRSGNNVAVVARPQVAAAQSNLYGMPSTVEVSKVVETVAPVAVVIDTEKETLRAENVALKAEVSELKTQIAELTAGQSRMEAMLAQLVAAQAVKTEEVSIPEIVEVVAPVAPAEVVETEEQQLARLEEERMNFFRACEYDNYEATGEETLDFDQRAELNKLDEEIKTLKWLMNIPVADRAAAIEARRLEKEEAIRKSTEALANINKPGADLSGLFN